MANGNNSTAVYSPQAPRPLFFRNPSMKHENLNLPLQLLSYACEHLEKCWYRNGAADLQETFPIYMDIISMAMDEIARLRDESCNVAQRCSNGQETLQQPGAM